MDRGGASESQPKARATGQAIRDLLNGRNKQARFMTELYAALRRDQIDKEAADRALVELESAGEIMVRDHFCADPHLAGVDLRVITIVEKFSGGDPQMSAIQAIDKAWNKWLGEYLSNHRCG
ncbi:MAG: hypothetical protein ACREQO_16990 [Candidatus Binatia bacterium]